jgi:hypothetical protein
MFHYLKGPGVKDGKEVAAYNDYWKEAIANKKGTSQTRCYTCLIFISNNMLHI